MGFYLILWYHKVYVGGRKIVFFVGGDTISIFCGWSLRQYLAMLYAKPYMKIYLEDEIVNTK
jgi:hypothetical protein